MAKYKVGDKVKVLGDEIHYYDTKMREFVGKTCTIHKVVDDVVYELEECKFTWNPFGYYHWHADWLALADNTTKKLIVTTDGETTTAKLIDGKQTIKTATAKCSKDDEFCFETGAQIAVDRLLGKKPAEPEEPKFTKADLKDGMFGYCKVKGLEGEREKWFVVVGGKLVYESGGFEVVSFFDEHLYICTAYGHTTQLSVVIDGAYSFDHAKNKLRHGAGIVYERK